MTENKTPETQRLFRADVVVRKKHVTESHKSGIVSRCYHDEVGADNRSFSRTGLDRALKPDEVGVLWYPAGARQIVSVKDLKLLDRIFSVGSICKRSNKDINSGVVISANTLLKLQHVFSKEEIDHLVPAEDVVKAKHVVRGDHVVVDDWIGEVDAVMEEAIVANQSNDRLVRVCDMGGHLMLGRISKDHFHEYHDVGLDLTRLGITEASIVDIKQTVLYIKWIAINQMLSPEEQAKRPKPPALWTDFERLTLVNSFCERYHEIGDRVVFKSQQLKDKHGAKVTYHGKRKLAVDAMLVLETRSQLEVLWQDGSRTTELASNLVPHANLDEHESWPGDWVYWKSEDHDKVPRIIQSMDPAERTAVVRTPWMEPAQIETVPSLEIDVEGPDHSVFSLHRGDTVMICARNTGFKGPFLTTVGDPRNDLRAHEMRNALLHTELNVIAPKTANKDVVKTLRAAADATGIEWYGTVVDLLLDGSCQIRLPCGKVINESLEKLLILSDSAFSMHTVEEMVDEPIDPWDMDGHGFYDDEYSDEDMDDADYDYYSDTPWVDPSGQIIGDGRDDWEDVSDGSLVTKDSSEVEDEDDKMLPIAVNSEANVTKDSQPALGSDYLAPVAMTIEDTTLYGDQTEVEQSTAKSHDGQADKTTTLSALAQKTMAGASKDDAWSQFAVLEEAPPSHAFISKPSCGQPGPAFFKRLQKEYKVLQSSLPETILVRTYEDRSDLLRVLIFGSEGTPYEHAPFLIDFQLSIDFPSKPPIAHFHSWTNGHGRVSPNLYEDGKVCLSVLGTWFGEAEENWNASKSSLLQVFVSIQALVLVREPYFTEPAYEKLKGEEESKINSRLYNEKAYILSRGFVRHVLERPPEGLETEINIYYHKTGHLDKVLNKAQTLIERTSRKKEAASQTISTAEKTYSEELIEDLTKGGSIMLSRSVKALQTIVERQSGV